MGEEKKGYKSGAREGVIIGGFVTVGMLTAGPLGASIGAGIGIAINLFNKKKVENNKSKNEKI